MSFEKMPVAPEEDVRDTILHQAERVIYGDREKTYGRPDKNLQSIAEYWKEYLGGKYGCKPGLTAEDVCYMMILLKVARLQGQARHQDSLVDIAGYAALVERVRNSYRQAAEERYRGAGSSSPVGSSSDAFSPTNQTKR